MTTDACICLNIRRMAVTKGVRLKRLAEAIGKDKTVFSKMLAGKATIHARYIPAIAEELGCSCDELLRGDDNALLSTET